MRSRYVFKKPFGLWRRSFHFEDTTHAPLNKTTSFRKIQLPSISISVFRVHFSQRISA